MDLRSLGPCTIFTVRADFGPLWSQHPFIHLTMHLTAFIEHLLCFRQWSADAQDTVMSSQWWGRRTRSKTKSVNSVTSGSGHSSRKQWSTISKWGGSCHLGYRGPRVSKHFSEEVTTEQVTVMWRGVLGTDPEKEFQRKKPQVKSWACLSNSSYHYSLICVTPPKKRWVAGEMWLTPF